METSGVWILIMNATRARILRGIECDSLADGSLEMRYWVYEEPWAAVAGSARVEDGYLRWRLAAGERP